MRVGAIPMIWHSALAGIACVLSLAANRISVMRLTNEYRAADSYLKVNIHTGIMTPPRTVSMATVLRDRVDVRSVATLRETLHSFKTMREVTSRFVMKLNESHRGTQMRRDREKTSSSPFN